MVKLPFPRRAPRLSYFKFGGANFGDALNDVLVPRLFGVEHAELQGEKIRARHTILAVGSILNRKVRLPPGGTGYVFGAGAGYWPEPPPPLEVLFVRGPLTCEHLGYDPALAASDAAYALHDWFAEHALEEKPFAYGLVPHHKSLDANAERWQVRDERVLLIDPRAPLEQVVRQVSRCEKIVAECLHGAVAADILRIPHAVIQTTPTFHAFKWLDWLESLDLPFEPRRVPLQDGVLDTSVFWRLRFQHSSEERLRAIIVRMGEETERMRAIVADIRAGRR